MWKITVVLVLTALAVLMARYAYEAPLFNSHLGAVSQGSALQTPPIMYAGIRG
jgi:hypothetical protein